MCVCSIPFTCAELGTDSIVGASKRKGAWAKKGGEIYHQAIIKHFHHCHFLVFSDVLFLISMSLFWSDDPKIKGPNHKSKKKRTSESPGIYTDIVYFMLPYIFLSYNYILKFGDKQRSVFHLDFEIFPQVKIVGCAWHSDLSSFMSWEAPEKWWQRKI